MCKLTNHFNPEDDNVSRVDVAPSDFQHFGLSKKCLVSRGLPQAEKYGKGSMRQKCLGTSGINQDSKERKEKKEANTGKENISQKRKLSMNGSSPFEYYNKSDGSMKGYVKSWVYADKPQTLDHLEDNIRRRVIADIRLQMLEKVIENWTSRLDYIRASRGSPMPEIIFKMRQTSSDLLNYHQVTRTTPELVPPLLITTPAAVLPYTIGNQNEEVVNLHRQIDLESNNNDTRTLRDPHNQDLAIDEVLEMHEQEQDIESLDLVQSEDRMTVENSLKSLRL
ncbi:hypothetical protein TNCV_768301 [Trichonephila clavipes]|nr:hypothetical protein TNCV_768301 [Trichonephila clavipes]